VLTEQENITPIEPPRYESNLDKFKRSKAETNKALGVTDDHSPLNKMTK